MEKTTCYKCDTEIEATHGEVHPLCSACDKSFEDWFALALEGKV